MRCEAGYKTLPCTCETSEAFRTVTAEGAAKFFPQMPCKECIGWKQLHDTNELCINNQYAEILRMRELVDRIEEIASKAHCICVHEPNPDCTTCEIQSQIDYYRNPIKDDK